MKTSDDGIDLIKSFEGCRLEAYQDSVGIWTIGYGHTGKEVVPGMVLTEDQAEELLRKDLDWTEGAVSAMCPSSIRQCQFDALVSFAFNVGVGSLAKSTLLKMLKVGQVQEAADQFLRWNRAGGQVVSGLTRRREAERALFLS